MSVGVYIVSINNSANPKANKNWQDRIKKHPVVEGYVVGASKRRMRIQTSPEGASQLQSELGKDFIVGPNEPLPLDT